MGIKSDTAGDYSIILIRPSPLGRSQPSRICRMAGHTHTHTRRDERYTSVSMSTSFMPKKGLIAIPGTISASGSEGLGAMQMPPVSENTKEK